MSETAVRSNSEASSTYAAGGRAPLARVDHEPVRDVENLLQLDRPPLGLAPPAAEDGQIGDEQRRDDRAGMMDRIATEPDLDHLRENLVRHPGQLEALQLGARDDLALAARLGDQEDRPRRVALGQARERHLRLRMPLRRAPDDVRHRARAELRHAVGLLEHAKLPELPFDVGDDAH